MANQPDELGWKALLIIGGVLLLVSGIAESTIVSQNIGFLRESGQTVILAYVLAATAMIGVPLLTGVIGYTLHLHMTRMLATAFCAWISFEETLHASEGWHAPQGAVTAVSTFVSPTTSKGVVLVTMALLVWAVYEVVAHFLHTGMHFTNAGLTKRRVYLSRQRRRRK